METFLNKLLKNPSRLSYPLSTRWYLANLQYGIGPLPNAHHVYVFSYILIFIETKNVFTQTQVAEIVS